MSNSENRCGSFDFQLIEGTCSTLAKWVKACLKPLMGPKCVKSANALMSDRLKSSLAGQCLNIILHEEILMP